MYVGGERVLVPLENLMFGDRNNRSSYTKSLAAFRGVIENLVIAGASASDGHQDYIRFDPESDDPQVAQPTVTFDFKDSDARDDDIYQWRLDLRETDGTTQAAATVQGTVELIRDGKSSVTVDIPPTLNRGVYGFNVQITKFGRREEYVSYDSHGEGTQTIYGALDVQSLRSGATISATSLQLEDGEDSSKLKFHYRIYSGEYKPLSQVKIEALDGALTRGENSVDGPKTVQKLVSDPDHVVDAPWSAPRNEIQL